MIHLGAAATRHRVNPQRELQLLDFEQCFNSILPRHQDIEKHSIDLLRPQLSQGRFAALRDKYRATSQNGVWMHIERHVRVERCADPPVLAGVWSALYQRLVARHRINGLAAFSPTTLARQLEVPGVVLFRAERAGTTVGMTVWYTAGSVAYYHLAAYHDAGYAVGASFAIFDFALRHFAETGVQWLDLGGAPGLDADGSDGLSRFKRGWATGTRPAYLCGRIFDRPAYAALVEAARSLETTYFPAYRHGNFDEAGRFRHSHGR